MVATFKGFSKTTPKLETQEQIAMDFALAKDTGTKLEVFTEADATLLKEFITELPNELGDCFQLHCITSGISVPSLGSTIWGMLWISEDGEVRFRVMFTPAFLTIYRKVYPYRDKAEVLDKLTNLVLVQSTLALENLGIAGGIYNHTYSWVPGSFLIEGWIEDVFEGCPDIDNPLLYKAVKAFRVKAIKASSEVTINHDLGIVSVSKAR